MTLTRTAVPLRPWPWPALAAGLAGSLAVPLALVTSSAAEGTVPGWAAVVRAVGAGGRRTARRRRLRRRRGGGLEGGADHLDTGVHDVVAR
ncbi:hypothetical protein [Georgenia sp. SUBG003]|uniref:hypothetical protein n=1 Tax=Georgenia sp. SUBG003 TaxID=1497974 RepID=UPI003AB2224D